MEYRWQLVFRDHPDGEITDPVRYPFFKVHEHDIQRKLSTALRQGEKSACLGKGHGSFSILFVKISDSGSPEEVLELFEYDTIGFVSEISAMLENGHSCGAIRKNESERGYQSFYEQKN